MITPITVKLGRLTVEVYGFDYVPPYHGSLYCPPEPEHVDILDEDAVWVAPRKAPSRRRPKRVAKKLARRDGDLHFRDNGRPLTEDELERMHDDERVQERLCEIAGEDYDGDYEDTEDDYGY